MALHVTDYLCNTQQLGGRGKRTVFVDRIRKQLKKEWLILPLGGPHQLPNVRKTVQNRFSIIFACCLRGLSISRCDSGV